MTQAWQHRESEQQQFIEKLAHTVHTAADESESYELFVIEFLTAVLVHFRFEIDPHRAAATHNRTGATWLVDSITRQIKGFCRVESERKHLLYRLFTALQPTVASWSHRDYLRDQILKTEDVFGAPSATAEIEER